MLEADYEQEICSRNTVSVEKKMAKNEGLEGFTSRASSVSPDLGREFAPHT